MNIIVASPYCVQSLHGNSISAKRIASILREAGHEVDVIQSGDALPDDSEVIIALHARKSHAAIVGMKKCCPHAMIILYLTGTDLYGDIPDGDPLAKESLELADSIVVSQDASLRSVPLKYRSKAKVVYNSISLPVLDPVDRERDLFTIASHMRAVKQPFFVTESLSLLDDSVRVKLMGSEIDGGSADQARKLMKKESRFEWLGEQTYEQTITWMSRSLATINTSLAEGGANSVGESIVLGIPVLATRIEGNIGMLGEDYDGYFSSDSPAQLAKLIHEISSNESFQEHLEKQVKERSEKYSRENEGNGWLALL